MTLGNGIQVTRTYDKNYQVRTLTAGAVMDRSYTPDSVGNIEVITDNLDAARSQSFAYDDLYRLTNANGIYGTMDYTYDKVGNRLTYTRTGSSPAQDSYHYMPQTNLLQTVEGTHSELFQYDADGNTTVRTPGANNPVPAITDPDDYTYNAGGQRLLKQNTSDRIFHYDLDGRLIEETDGQGNLIKAYIWLHGQPFARFDAGGAIYYYHNDHLGTPQHMTDIGGTVVWAADYLPFGQADVTVETVVNDLRFAGQYYDSETGLHYNYHRYYDPSLGRYLRADPIGLAGGINPYSYVRNNPVNFIDPFGLYAEVTIIGNKVNIRIPISYYGEGATDETVQGYNKAIESMWSGKFGKWEVSTKVVRGDQNRIHILLDEGRSKVITYNISMLFGLISSTECEGEWYAYGYKPKKAYPNTPWVAAHEAGHLIGLGDKYFEPVKEQYCLYCNTQWSTDYKNNIMARHGKKVEERNIDDIVKLYK